MKKYEPKKVENTNKKLDDKKGSAFGNLIGAKKNVKVGFQTSIPPVDTKDE